MWTNANLEIIEDDAKYISKVDGAKYARNHPKGDIPTNKSKERELFEVTETPRPADTKTKIVTDFSIENIDGVYTQVWNTRTKTANEKKQENEGAAFSALHESDTVALRCFKAGVTFPTDWQAYVTSLRAYIAAPTTTAHGGPPSNPDGSIKYPAGTE